MLFIQFSSQAQNTTNISKDSVVNSKEVNSLVFVSGKKQPYSFSEHIKYKASGDGLFTRGNVYRTLLIFRASINYSTPHVDLSLTPVYTYGENNYVPAENDYSFTMYGNYRQKEPIFFWGMGLAEHSRSRGIDARTQLGAGLGINFIKHTDSSAVFFTTGLLHEMADYKVEYRLETWRSSNRLKGRHWIFEKKLRLTYEIYYQPSIIDTDNIRMRLVTAIEYPLNKWIAFRTSIQDSYESVVLPGKVSNDFSWTFGLSMGN